MHRYSAQIKRIFSNIVSCTIEVEKDTKRVIIRLELDSDQNTALAEYDRWVDWVVENIKPEEAEYLYLTFTRV